MLKNKNIFIKLLSIGALVCIGALYGGIAYAATVSYTVVPLATLPGLTTGITAGGTGTPVNPTTYIQGLYAFAIGIGVVIAVASGVYAGIEYMLSETSFSSVSKAKERMWNVLSGAALLLCSWLLLNLINPQLVNWNLNLGTINTTDLSGDISANNAAQAAQQQAAAYATQAANNLQSAASASSTLTDAQAWLDNLAGDSDPDNQCAGTAYASANPDTCEPIAQAQVAVETAQANVIQTSGDSAITTAYSSTYTAEQAYLAASCPFPGAPGCTVQTTNEQAVYNAVQTADQQAANSITQMQNLLSQNPSQQIQTSLNQMVAEKSAFDSQIQNDATLQRIINYAKASKLTP